MPHRHRAPPAPAPSNGARNMCSDRSPNEIRPFRGLIAGRNENYKLPESLLTQRSNYLAVTPSAGAGETGSEAKPRNFSVFLSSLFECEMISEGLCRVDDQNYNEKHKVSFQKN
ncbi:hypothetical protein Zmor_021011 [Zophobas morio]|uniref:Uncharacterized protein n=1 Tax=Zophobas morio TaxID=2755281 RepID=A0AA38I230_9CUCU|nr:hypothetical protein Zmor_021011 [Zophobas morio]